jgi:hypothetical protein
VSCIWVRFHAFHAMALLQTLVVAFLPCLESPTVGLRPLTPALPPSPPSWQWVPSTTT